MDKVLFASQFILERKLDDQPIYPAHNSAQICVNDLRMAGEEVDIIVTFDAFKNCFLCLDKYDILHRVPNPLETIVL